MVCIYCHSNTLQVVNSRPQKRINQVWRRRACQSCGATFTTQEAVDHSKALVVQHGHTSGLIPFIREKLFVSILKSCQHRTNALAEAIALTDTVIAKLTTTPTTQPLHSSKIVQTTLETLRRFDTAAAVQYNAYHPLPKTK